MIAYQMIYTACGKDKSGAFSVWSKSANVTKKECDEIIKLMNYRKPKNAPYEPTEEEIERLFPKKYGYFELSSGRKCIAQSSYIGNVYSDMDARSGNFIIHAYIFDALDGFNPYNIFGSNLFKTKLTYKEWHDDPLIEDLPAVELNPLAPPTEAEVKATVVKYASALPSFLEAVLRCGKGEDVLCFNDSEENQAKLYRVLGVLLPASTISGTTFSTQYSTQAEYGLQTIGAVPVKLRNIYETTFSYDEELAEGHFGFDFEKNKVSNISDISAYVRDILRDVNSLGYFDLLKKIDAINGIMLRADCDIDTANTVYNLVKKNYDWFTSLNEFQTAMGKAVSLGYVNEREIAADAYNNVIKKEKWAVDNSTLEFIKKIYPLSDGVQKNDIIVWTYKSIDKFVPGNQNAQSYLQSFKNTLSFAWEDFVNHVLTGEQWNGVAAQLSDFNKAYVFYNIYVQALNANRGNNQAVCNNIIAIVKKAVVAKYIDGIRQFFQASKVMGGKYEEWLINQAFSSIFAPAADEASLRFGFDVINCISDEGVKAMCLERFISANANSQLLIPVYSKYYEANQDLYERLENRLSGSDMFKAFVSKKDAYLFSRETKVSAKQLDKYFDKFYSKGNDSGAYYQKLKPYLEGLREKERLTESLRLYEKVAKLNDNFCDVLRIIALIEKSVYSLPLEQLSELKGDQYKALIEIDRRLKQNNKATSSKLEILQTLYTVTGKIGGKDYLYQVVRQDTLYQKLSPSQLTILWKEYAKVVLESYSETKNSKKCDNISLVKAYFNQPFRTVNSIGDIILSTLKEGSKEYYELMSDFFEYGFTQPDSLAVSIRNFIKSYVEKMGRGESKKLFKKVQSTVSEKSRKAVDQFIDSYLDEHKSVFAALFGRKPKEDKEQGKKDKKDRK